MRPYGILIDLFAVGLLPVQKAHQGLMREEEEIESSFLVMVHI